MAKISTKAGDIIRVDLDPVKGGEKNKTRPCLVLVGSGHPWRLITVVPITDSMGKRPPALFVPVPNTSSSGLKKPSCIDCFQIRCISEERVSAKIGAVSAVVLAEVRTRLARILDIGEEHVS